MEAESLARLAGAALRIAVHADALQCAVDDTQDVFTQMIADQRRAVDYEQRLVEAIAATGRVTTLSDALSDAKAQVHHQRPGSHSTTTASGAGGSAVDAAQAAVARLKLEQNESERRSVLHKLRQLERAKAACGQVSAADVLARALGRFRFHDALEALWDPAVCTVNGRNVDALVTRARERMSKRYKTAFDLLRATPFSERSDPVRLHGAAHYSAHLTSASNRDVAFAAELEGMSKHTLAHHFAMLQRSVLVEGPPKDCRREQAGDSVLASRAHYEFVPMEGLRPPTRVATLPPARHILTRRFSFADAAELASLEALRVEMQQIELRSIIDATGLSTMTSLDDLRLHLGCCTEGRACSVFVRDVAAVSDS